VSDESSDFPRYKSPPVGELVCGVFFDKLNNLKTAHLGLLWEEFRDDYPTSEDAAPLGAPRQQLGPEYFDIPPPPRVWFVHKDDKELIQVQPDWFLYNWRRQKGEDIYPHYEHVIKQFKKCFAKFKKFLTSVGIGEVTIRECMLTYINHIPEGEGWGTLADLANVFSDFRSLSDTERFLPPPTNIGWNREFPLPDGKGRLVVKLNKGIRRTDKKSLLLLELSANGLGEDNSENHVWAWFDLAHEWIVKGFTDLTAPTIQNEVWGREK